MALRPGKYRLGTPHLVIDKQGVGSIQYPVYGLNTAVQVPVDIPLEEWEQARELIAHYLSLKFEPSVVDKYLAATANRTTEWLKFETEDEATGARRFDWEAVYDDVEEVTK